MKVIENACRFWKEDKATIKKTTVKPNEVQTLNVLKVPEI
jgi:hypothetical protein